jgi:hypothetical protein
MNYGNHNKKPDVSLPRKIFIFAFIVAFWVFYYWFSGKQSQQKPVPQQQIERPSK